MVSSPSRKWRSRGPIGRPAGAFEGRTAPKLRKVVPERRVARSTKTSVVSRRSISADLSDCDDTVSVGQEPENEPDEASIFKRSAPRGSFSISSVFRVICCVATLCASLLVILFTAFLIISFVNEVQTRIDQQKESHLAKQAACRKNFIDNHCDQHLPALREYCQKQEDCISADAEATFNTMTIFGLVGDVIEDFIARLSFRTIGVVAVAIYLVMAIRRHPILGGSNSHHVYNPYHAPVPPLPAPNTNITLSLPGIQGRHSPALE